MTRYKYLLLPFVLFAVAFSSDNITYYDAADFILEGTSISPEEKEGYYDRLPLEYKELVREPVWALSKNSAGMSVRFMTNSKTIAVKWDLLNDFHMCHMAGTGIRGLDLYCKENGKWQYVITGKPYKKNNDKVLIKNMKPEMKEYKLYLPLYDGLKKLEIGIDSLAQITSPEDPKKKPIVFYGTSITQGGCASRPGMAYTNIISRKLDRDCINLGFSGNGRMEKPIAEFIASIDAEFIVIDCLPNMKSENVVENMSVLVDIIRSRVPDVPIVFVENIMYTNAYFEADELKILTEKNATLKKEFRKLKKKGIKNIFYIESKNLSSPDYEGTVDGCHLTDLGFMHISDVFIKYFKKFKLL